MIKSLYCEDISEEYEFKSEKFKGCIDQLKVKCIRPKWKHNGIQNITDAPTLTSIYILIYIFAKESVKICRFKTFWVRIIARGTLWLFRCFNIHVKMCVSLRYCARKLVKTMCLPRH